MAKRSSANSSTLADVVRVFERIAPTRLAEEWDNVGLLAGDYAARIKRILLCIDLTADVVDEAIAAKADLIMAYHPPIFRSISRLHGHGSGTDAHVFRCIAAGIAVYSMHTALDAADGGTNDVLAELCGLRETRAIEHAAGPAQCKLVIFIPEKDVDAVAGAIFEAGAGRIGEYDMCSYRLSGEGTFRGSDETNPTIGKAGQFERVAEVRVETVVPQRLIPQVVEALRKAHPYEEPAFDLYPLTASPEQGAGRHGPLARPSTPAALARRLRRSVPAPTVQIVGPPDREVTHAVVCVGAAGRLPFKLPLTPQHVIVTGEIRHHDALTIRRLGCTAIALSHWASERPALGGLAERIGEELAAVEVGVSEADADPFGPA